MSSPPRSLSRSTSGTTSRSSSLSSYHSSSCSDVGAERCAAPATAAVQPTESAPKASSSEHRGSKTSGSAAVASAVPAPPPRQKLHPSALTPAARAAFVTRQQLKHTLEQYQRAVVQPPTAPTQVRPATTAYSSMMRTRAKQDERLRELLKSDQQRTSRPASGATPKRIEAPPGSVNRDVASVPRAPANRRSLPQPASALIFTPRSALRRRRPHSSPGGAGSNTTEDTAAAAAGRAVAPHGDGFRVGPLELTPYNSLRDESLGNFFAKPATHKLLLHTGVIAEDGRIVQLNRAFGRVVVAERNFVLAESDEHHRQDEAAFLRAKLKHRVEMTRQQHERVERVQLLRAADLARLKARHDEQVDLMRRAGLEVVRDDEAAGDDAEQQLGTDSHVEGDGRRNDTPCETKVDQAPRQGSGRGPASVAAAESADLVSRDSSRSRSADDDDEYASDNFTDEAPASPRRESVLVDGHDFVLLRTYYDDTSPRPSLQVLAPIMFDDDPLENGTLVSWQPASRCLREQQDRRLYVWRASLRDSGVWAFTLTAEPIAGSNTLASLCCGEGGGDDFVIGRAPSGRVPHFEFVDSLVGGLPEGLSPSESVMRSLSAADSVSRLPPGAFVDDAAIKLVNLKAPAMSALACVILYKLN